MTILETKERPPGGAFRIWRMLLASLLILVVAPIPSLNARQLERGTAFWADILNKMSDSDTALVHPKAVKVARGGLSSRDRDLIRELERMSPKDRFLFCAAANCDLLDPFGGEVPKVLTRAEIVAVFRAASEREEQGNARIGVSYLLCVAAVACSALSLRRRPWLQGEMSIARSGRSAVAFRMGLVAMGMALVAGGWAAYLAVIASRLPGIVPIGMGAGCISLAWVASRFFADANRLRSTGASGTT